METLEEFMAKQQAALERKRQELAELEALGEVPGLGPRMVHGQLYGTRHVTFNLRSLPEFLAWARANCCPVHAIRGRYTTMHPWVPVTQDYDDARIVATGGIVVDYSSIMRRASVEVFLAKGFRISFDTPALALGVMPDLRPLAQWNHSRTKVEKWIKPPKAAVQHQFIRPATDGQSCDLESLLTFDQFETHFAGLFGKELS